MSRKLSIPKEKTSGETKNKSDAMLWAIEHRQAAVPATRDIRELTMKPIYKTSTGEDSNKTITPESPRTNDIHCEIGVDMFEKLRVILGVSDEVANIKELTPPDLVNLGGNGVRSIGDLADLCIDELIAIIGSDVLTRAVAGNIIMAARKHLFKGDANYTQFF
jgi:hypothetical protein